jgi:hypothetical protein
MRIISTILTMCVIILVVVRCSDQEEIRKPNEIELTFKVNGVKETVIAQIVCNKATGRLQLVSPELVEIKSKHHKTKQTVYVYALKSQIRYDKNGRRVTEWPEEDNPGGSENQGTVKRGYYGYVDGCFIYGTLITFASGEEYFFPSTGVNAVANPPICPGGEWA